MNILITGGGGFIGTALAFYLKRQDHNVYLLDFESKFQSQHKKNFTCITADVRNYQSLKNLPNVDIVYHFAAQTSGAISQEQPELDVDTNIRGTLNICRFVRKAQVSKLIFSSSMAVYGDSSEPLAESSALQPKSVYGCSKIAAETFIRSFSMYGFNYTIFRFFNVYGPGQDMRNLRQGMASIFMSQAISGKEIHVTGSLERYRDFVYIDDVVSALAFALTGLDHGIYNVGSGIRTTVKELIQEIFHVLGKNESGYKIINVGGHDGDQFGTVSDCRKLRTESGWSPEVSLRDGLRAMSIYAKEILL